MLKSSGMPEQFSLGGMWNKKGMHLNTGETHIPRTEIKNSILYFLIKYLMYVVQCRVTKSKFFKHSKLKRLV